MYAQRPRFETRLAARRTMDRDHRFLARLLRPGMSVLDVGCANGEITVGIAEAVAPGRVLGVDREAGRLDLARRLYRDHSNLEFDFGDATTLHYSAEFDLVTAARLLQWIADAPLAIARMTAALKPAGTLAILDFNHVHHTWDPEPPPEFRHFYSAFLAWRASNGWDNEMATHLPALFESAGLENIQSHPQDEIIERGDLDFAKRAALWLDAIDNLGDSMAATGFLAPAAVKAASVIYADWIETGLERQTLQMRTVTGTLPDRRLE